MTRGWKTVKHDIEAVVKDAKNGPLSPRTERKYVATLKKIVLVIGASAAAAALVYAGFKRNPDLAKQFWNVGKTNKNIKEFAGSVHQAVNDKNSGEALPFSVKHRSMYNNKHAFTQTRLTELKAHRDKAVEKIKQGTLNAHSAREQVWGALRVTDPPKVREALMNNFSIRANAAQGLHKRPAYWLFDPEKEYKKYIH